MPSNNVTKTILDTLRVTGLATLSKKFTPNVGSILMLHRVTSPNTKSEKFAPNAHLAINSEFLDELLDNLTRQDYDFVSLDEAQRRIQSNKKHRRFIAITLDDGYLDNLENAVPVFEKFKAPYTIFIAPGLVDGRATLWWEDLENVIASQRSVSFEIEDRIYSFSSQTVKEKNDAFNQILEILITGPSEAKQREIMQRMCNFYGFDAQKHAKQSIMDWGQLKILNETELCTLGAHTLHHYAVARLPKDQCRNELEQSGVELSKKLGVKPQHFAYPYGYPAAAAARDFEVAKECGYHTAVTTRHGVCTNAHADHLTALPRISINGHFQKVDFVNTLLSGAPMLLQNKGRTLNVG